MDQHINVFLCRSTHDSEVQISVYGGENVISPGGKLIGGGKVTVFTHSSNDGSGCVHTRDF